MFRYLTQQEIDPYLNLGKTVEVFLGRINEDNEIISWLGFQKTKINLIVVTYYEVYDEGNLEWLDLYAFSSVDLDMEFNIKEFDTLEEATNYIREQYNLPVLNFLPREGIQQEYKKLLISEERE